MLIAKAEKTTRGCRRIRAAALLALSAGLMVYFGNRFLQMHTPDRIYPGPGVTAQGRLSDYLPNLRGSPMDTDIYYLKGKEPGGKFLVLGGTHNTEVAGPLAAITIVENAVVRKGELIVIPRANASGATATTEMIGFPEYVELKTSKGLRSIRTGTRGVNCTDQFPDPDVYVVPLSHEKWPGMESKNINRAYPGRARGRPAERVTFALIEMVKREHINMVLDLHEAPPEIYVLNCIVAHERAMDLAGMTVMGLYEQGITEMKLFQSPPAHGISHREIGDATDAYVLLAETNEIALGAFTGRLDQELLQEGKDPFYGILARSGRLFAEYDPQRGVPLKERVGRHLSTIMELSRNLGVIDPAKEMDIEDVPEYPQMMENGLERYLEPKDTKEEG